MAAGAKKMGKLIIFFRCEKCSLYMPSDIQVNVTCLEMTERVWETTYPRGNIWLAQILLPALEKKGPNLYFNQR